MRNTLLSSVLLAASQLALMPQAGAQQTDDLSESTEELTLVTEDESRTIPRARDIEREEIPEEDTSGVVARSIVIVDGAHTAASVRFGNFMGQVDGFFSNAGTDDDAVSNGSWARIRVEGVRAEGRDFRLATSLKLRAVLPQTERKLKLLVSTENEGSQEVGEVPNSSDRDDGNASFALRFIQSAQDNINLDIGVRRRDGDLQIFGRINGRFTLHKGEYWTARAANSYYYYNRSGFENTLSFDFRRKIQKKDNIYFRTFTGFEWENDQRGAIISGSLGYYWQIDERRSLALEALGSYHTALNAGIDDRFRGHEYRVRWRHNVWRPWFFYEFWPSVSWPASTDYRQVEGFLLRAEVIIGQRY